MPAPPIELPERSAVVDRIRYHNREAARLKKLLRLVEMFRGRSARKPKSSGGRRAPR